MSAPAETQQQAPYIAPSGYLRFGAAGAIACALTHGGMTPVDVIKTRIQLEPKGTPYNSMGKMFKHIVTSEGPRGLLTGFGPTAVGYMVQGGLKFAGFEFFKRQGVLLCGGLKQAEDHRTAIHVLGASTAEVIATTALTPLEAARIRLVSNPSYASGLMGAITRMGKEEGFRGFYAGYTPILFKQIPYAVGQFAVNEQMHELVKNTPSLDKLEKSGKSGQITIQLGCGIVAGVAAAVLSHPADTLLSKINKGGGGSGSSLKRLAVLAKETGPIGIWAGLGARTVMTMCLVAGQFLLFQQVSALVGAPQGVEIHKKTKSAVKSE